MQLASAAKGKFKKICGYTSHIEQLMRGEIADCVQPIYVPGSNYLLYAVK